MSLRHSILIGCRLFLVAGLLEGYVTGQPWPAWLRGTLLGFPFGALPAGGAEIPTFLSYTTEKRLSKNKEEWGHGAIEGVAGPEAANNAAFSGVLVPLLTLGLPTSATAAILLVAFQIYNLQPGPLLFQKSPELVWALIASLYIGNVMLLILNLPLIRIWIKILAIPRSLLGLVVGNLLGNAVKFSGVGGEVGVRVERDRERVTLAVSDSGDGIPAQEIPRVFERFYRGPESGPPDVPGFGLGLALCRAVIEAYGGTIAVASTSGTGSVFTVRVPIAS